MLIPITLQNMQSEAVPFHTSQMDDNYHTERQTGKLVTV